MASFVILRLLDAEAFRRTRQETIPIKLGLSAMRSVPASKVQKAFALIICTNGNDDIHAFLEL